MSQPDTSADIHGLPVVEVPSVQHTTPVLVIILSGDGGWADLDKQVGEGLSQRGLNVVGLDMRHFLRDRHQTPETSAAAITRIARYYLAHWQLRDFALVGYSRGSVVLPFVANRMDKDVRAHLVSLTYLTLLERASFQYHFSDLWRTTSGKHDIPILPELEKLKGVPMLCVYGVDEPESLCRTAPAGLMTIVARPGKHHFDGNYPALADLIYHETVRLVR